MFTGGYLHVNTSLYQACYRSMLFRFEDDYSFSFKIRISDVEIRRYLRIKASHLWSIANQTIFSAVPFPADIWSWISHIRYVSDALQG